MSGAPLLSVREARVGFFTARGPLRAVDGVSFDLEKGRTLGIVGESGSGKSVLVRSLIGLVGESSGAEVGGQVQFEGRDLRALPAREFRGVLGRDIGVVFQDPMTSLNPVMKIGRQIGEGLRLNRGLDAKAAAVRAVELLTEAIAIAIACAPKLLIADEPTTALDVTVQRQILDLLQREQRERGMAMILITHDLGVAAGRADDIMVMYAGRAVEMAKTRELFRSPRMPYTEALLRSLPRLTDPTHTRLSAIPGRPPDLARRSGGCAFAPRCRYRTDHCDEEQPTQTWEGARGYACFHPRGVNA